MAFTPYNGDLLLHLASYVVLAHRIETEPRGAYETAAEELGVDVSVLRRRIQSLASWFDVRLTEGRGQSLRLSDAGDAIVAGGSRLLLDIERLRESLAELPSRLALAYDGALGADVMPTLIKRVRRADESLTLSLLRLDADAAVDQLRHGALDAAVVRLEQPPDGLVAELLCEEHVMLAVARESPLADRARLALRDLARLPLAVEARDAHTRRRVLDRLATLGGSVAIEAESRDALLALAEVGVAVGLLASVGSAATRPPRGVVMREVSKLFGSTHYYLLSHPDRTPAHHETLRDALTRALS
ncbi:MAG: hypothetical protein KC503_39230 [Myxococcales bacterium]|nr:hypothetical protein [Myxococcales bacterium]